MKRTFDIVPDSLSSIEKKIEFREFKYLLKRFDVALGDGQAWFNLHAEGQLSVFLEECAAYIVQRIFFPQRITNVVESLTNKMTLAERNKMRSKKTSSRDRDGAPTKMASIRGGGKGSRK
jgi:hypothetical protein